MENKIRNEYLELTNLGDKVEIVCVNASRQSSQIDFVLKEDYKVGFDYENYSE